MPRPPRRPPGQRHPGRQLATGHIVGMPAGGLPTAPGRAHLKGVPWPEPTQAPARNERKQP
jgi:hypothetical protein